MEPSSFKKKLKVLAGGVCLFVISGIFAPREASGLEIESITPGSGTVGITVTIKGTHTDAGFYGNPIWGTFGTTYPAQNWTEVRNDPDESTFTYTFNVDTQSYGTKVLTASEYDGSNIATTTFFILPNIYSCELPSGPVGYPVTIMGNGFGTTTIRIDFGRSQTITTASGNNNGTFSLTFIVDTQTYGTKIITAYNADNLSIVDTTTFFITSKIYYLSPTSGTFGTTVTVLGSGYGEQNSTVTIHFGLTQTITSVVIGNVNGTFSATFNVDTQPGGSNVITATGISDYGIPLATTVFVVLPEILSVSPERGTVSSIVTVEGRGYRETVTIDFGTHYTITSTQASSYGTFCITFIVSTQFYGTKPITARWLDYGIIRPAVTSAFIIIGRITLREPSSGVVGSPVTITGNGFDGTGTVIRIDFGTQETITSVVMSNDNGTFSITFLVNTQPYDTRVITVYGPTDNYDTTIFFIRPKINIVSPPLGIVGTSVTVEGVGYGTQTFCRVGFGITSVIRLDDVGVLQKKTSDNGTFSAYFYVNTQPGGTTVITLYHQLDLSIRATSTFFITSKIITVDPLSGKVGEVVTVIGNGYGLGTTVRIEFGTTVTITTTTTDKHGTFSTTFIVDTQPGNTRVITARDLGPNPSLVATSVFNVQGKIAKVFPLSGKPGDTVTIEGWGYDGTITVDFGTSYTITTTYIENSGTFTITFIVNTQPYGSKAITVSDIDTTGISSLDIVTWFKVVGKVILVSPQSGVVGSYVTIEGCGYGTNTTIRIDFGTQQTITTTVSDDIDGTFSTTFIIDTQPYDTRVITVYGPTDN
ncbi:TPA: hypothetical protein DCX16_04785, partial [bacterium]|nr:hypothetical protein [bacterium]